MNEFESRHRVAKAQKLALVVASVAKGKGTPSVVARRLTAEQREKVREIADRLDRVNGGSGVKPASNDTWAAVVSALETAEKLADDPFARLQVRRATL